MGHRDHAFATIMPIQQGLKIKTCSRSYFITRNIGRDHWVFSCAEIDQQGNMTALTNQVGHESVLLTFRIEGSNDGDG